MLSIIGYNLVRDKNALDNSLVPVENIRSTKIQNGTFDHYSVMRDISFPYDNTIPTKWDYLTIMDADFAGNINAGNIEFSAMKATSIVIKRREVGSFNWISVAEKKIDSPNDYSFIFNDNTNMGDVEYEYGLFPILNGVEGNPIVGKINSEFDGVFLADQRESFKLGFNIKYGNVSSIQKDGIFEPIGSKYPISIKNGITDYKRGSIEAGISVDDEMGNIDHKKTRQKVQLIEKFFKNGRAKILKDLNGLYIMVVTVGDIRISYDEPIGAGFITISCDWVEIGDALNDKDMYRNNLTGMVF